MNTDDHRLSEPNCMRCRHHAITHEIGLRYQCRRLGFKSAALPSKVVLESSGMPCQYFSPRPSNGTQDKDS